MLWLVVSWDVSEAGWLSPDQDRLTTSATPPVPSRSTKIRKFRTKEMHIANYKSCEKMIGRFVFLFLHNCTWVLRCFSDAMGAIITMITGHMIATGFYECFTSPTATTFPLFYHRWVIHRDESTTNHDLSITIDTACDVPCISQQLI